MKIESLDHIVLTVHDLIETCTFYEQILGMQVISFGEGRLALKFGNQKINLHQVGKEQPPTAANPQPGSADFCMITDEPIHKVRNHLIKFGIEILSGPVRKEGANGPIQSIYFNDPSGNLLEVSNYLKH